jgi:hypothetical protein
MVKHVGNSICIGKVICFTMIFQLFKNPCVVCYKVGSSVNINSFHLNTSYATINDTILLSCGGNKTNSDRFYIMHENDHRLCSVDCYLVTDYRCFGNSDENIDTCYCDDTPSNSTCPIYTRKVSYSFTVADESMFGLWSCCSDYDIHGSSCRNFYLKPFSK